MQNEKDFSFLIHKTDLGVKPDFRAVLRAGILAQLMHSPSNVYIKTNQNNNKEQLQQRTENVTLIL